VGIDKVNYCIILILDCRPDNKQDAFKKKKNKKTKKHSTDLGEMMLWS